MDRVITRALLEGWILNDGVEHLAEEGYLHGPVDPDDPELRDAINAVLVAWKTYEAKRDMLTELVEGYEGG